MSLKLIKTALIFFSISFVVSSELNQLKRENGPPKFMHKITKLNEKNSFLSTNIDKVNDCCCSSENQSKAENEELNQTKQELKQTKQELKQTKQELNQTKQELKQTKQELNQTKQELKQTKQELNQTKEQLSEVKTKLSDLEQITKQVYETLRDFINNYQKSSNEKAINWYEEGPATLYNLSSKSLVYTWKLRINESDTNTEYESQEFPVAKYGMNGQVKLVITQPNSSFIHFRFKRPYPAVNFTLKIYPRVTYVLRDESENEERKDVVLANDFIAYDTVVGFDKYDYSMGLNYFDQEIYIKDGWMTIEVHVSSPEEARVVQSDVEVFKGTIDNYHQLTKWSGRMYRVFSPYFYFDSCRAVIAFHLHDVTSGDDWLDVTIQLLTGENDNPYELRAFELFGLISSFTLFNQIDKGKNLTQTKEFVDTRVDFKFKIRDNFNEFVFNDRILYQARLF